MNNTDTKEYIYMLYVVPYDDLPIYVGRTKNLKKRLQKHLSDCKRGKSKKDKALKKILEEGYKIDIKILEEVDLTTPSSAEDIYITNFKAKGYPLLNSKGGDTDRLVVIDYGERMEWTEELFKKAKWTENGTGFGNKNEKHALINGVDFYRTGKSKLRFYYSGIGFVEVYGFNWNIKVKNACEYFTKGTEKNKKLMKMLKEKFK